MLEQSSLLLGPWTAPPSGEPGARVRAVQDAEGGALGFIRQAPVRGPRWLGGRTLEAYEMPDSSLVFCVRRGWGWLAGWHVADADGRLVGKLGRRTLLDGFGNTLAFMEAPAADGRGRFLAMDGYELGDYSLTCECTLVTFAVDMQGNPFAKMMLLAAVLIQ